MWFHLCLRVRLGGPKLTYPIWLTLPILLLVPCEKEQLLFFTQTLAIRDNEMKQIHWFIRKLVSYLGNQFQPTEIFIKTFKSIFLHQREFYFVSNILVSRQLINSTQVLQLFHLPSVSFLTRCWEERSIQGLMIWITPEWDILSIFY